MRTYKIAYTFTTSINAAAYITFSKSGRIRCMRWACYMDCVTDNGQVEIEASFTSVSQIGTNDTIGPIDEIKMATNFATSGLNFAAINEQRVVDIPVAAGERIYLNATVAGTVSNKTTLFLDVDEGGK